MAVINYAKARVLYGPPCKNNKFPGAQEAWDAHQMVMRHYGYKLRAADTGSRNCRNVTGGKLKSMHAFFIVCVIMLWNLAKAIAGGLAADFNWTTNPYGPRLVTDMPREMVDAILAIRTNNGVRVFMWGGYWDGNKDAMHYDIVCEPVDLATGINWKTVIGFEPEPQPELPEEDDVKNLLFHIPTERYAELPPTMRDNDSSGSWYYTDGKEFWWCPSAGHAQLQFDMGLSGSATPVPVSPSFLKELKPRSSADLNPNGALLPNSGGSKAFFFDADGNVSPAAKS